MFVLISHKDTLVFYIFFHIPESDISTYVKGMVYIPCSTCLSLTWTCCLVPKWCPTLLQPHGLRSTRLLCPCDFPGKKTGVGCPFLLQGIFLTKGSNQRLLQILYHWVTRTWTYKGLNQVGCTEYFYTSWEEAALPSSC